MNAENGERWHKLYEQALKEGDADKLIKLAEEINEVLEDKELLSQRIHCTESKGTA